MNFFSVFVTGANKGIGLAFTRQLLKLPNPPKHVFATCRRPENAKVLQDIGDSSTSTKVHILKTDVTDIKEIEAASKIVEETVGDKGLTLLINNAGVAEFQGFRDMTLESTNYHLSVNAIGPMMITQALLPMLQKAASSQLGCRMSFSRAGILNITTLHASLHNTGVQFLYDLGVPAYKISKAALHMAMRIIAASVKEDNILVTLMCPGWVKTDMVRGTGILEPHESIADMLSTVDKLNESHHGAFIDRFGNPYPW